MRHSNHSEYNVGGVRTPAHAGSSALEYRLVADNCIPLYRSILLVLMINFGRENKIIIIKPNSEVDSTCVPAYWHVQKH